VARFVAHLAQKALYQTWFELQAHKLGGRCDAVSQFLPCQRTNVHLRRYETIAQLAVESDDLAVKVGTQRDQESERGNSQGAQERLRKRPPSQLGCEREKLFELVGDEE
jgi:hypothetical protein